MPSERLTLALQRTWALRGAASLALRPLSWGYRLLAGSHKQIYALGLKPRTHLPVPVIVVGNVIVGGAGKTPVVIAVVQHLQSLGLVPGVVSRGYGRSGTSCVEVTANGLARDMGDEPLLIRQKTGAPTFVAARRVQAAQALLAEHPAVNVIVCDDGLQHHALQRDIEICVFDDRGIGNGLLLPAGPLREPWPRPIDLVLNTGALARVSGFAATRALAAYAVDARGGQYELARSNAISGLPILAVAAIAQPEGFFGMLRAQGVQLSKTVSLPDHYDFDSWMRSVYDGFQVICTEKDANKLWQTMPNAWAVPLLLTPEPAFFTALREHLARHITLPLSSTYGH